MKKVNKKHKHECPHCKKIYTCKGEYVSYSCESYYMSCEKHR